MKKNLFLLILIILMSSLIFLPDACLASNFLDSLKNTSKLTGYGETAPSPQAIIAPVIKGILGLTGMVFFILIVYGGFSYMVSQGKEDKIKTSRKIMINASIGLALIVMGYTISSFIVNLLATGNIPTGTPPVSTTPGGTPSTTPPANLPPVFALPEKIEIRWNQAVNFTVSATDPEGQEVNITKSGEGNFPSPTTGIPTATGAFSWGPNIEGLPTGKTSTLTFTATDALEAVVENVEIIVTDPLVCIAELPTRNLNYTPSTGCVSPADANYWSARCCEERYQNGVAPLPTCCTNQLYFCENAAYWQNYCCTVMGSAGLTEKSLFDQNPGADINNIALLITARRHDDCSP
jgi:uncharacterized membrane protein